MDLRGKVAFVTGAGRGIGRAVCRELQRRGAAGIVIADLDGELARDPVVLDHEQPRRPRRGTHRSLRWGPVRSVLMPRPPRATRAPRAGAG